MPCPLERRALARAAASPPSSGPGPSSPRASEPVDLDSLDPEYLEGLRAAISAVGFGLDVIERGAERAPPPPALLTQARLAARYGIGLDTVLRRYSAGYVLLSDFLVEEAERGGLQGAALQRLLRAQAALDRLLAAVSEEYAREARERPGNAEQRRAERIERLLAGELLDTSELAYDFGGTHLGLVGTGPGVGEDMKVLAAAFDRRLLTVCRGQEEMWAWLGGRRPLEMEDLARHVRERWPARIALAVGEPGEGLAGWRLTHRQARAALPIALRRPASFVRYADVALIAAVLQDDLLATSLREMYLEPLRADRDGGAVARETLRAYFAANRNASSAASLLGVSRQAVTNRLQAIETKLQCSLGDCAAQIEAAVQLDQASRHSAI